jgi:hypothetical protein
MARRARRRIEWPSCVTTARRSILNAWLPSCTFLHGIPADAPTWWRAANAVTGWVDHLQPIRGDRYAHALIGAGDRLKSQALELAAEMST